MISISVFLEDVTAGEVNQKIIGIFEYKATGIDKLSARKFKPASSELNPHITQ